MLRITLLSDTHGHIDEGILQQCTGSHEIWHAGDIGSPYVLDALQPIAPLRAVYGNIDNNRLRRQLPEVLVFECGGLRTLMLHIGALPPRYSQRVRQLLEWHQPHLLVCGHSHILRILPDARRGLVYLNPGAAGHEGFHSIRTLLQLWIEDGKLHKAEAVHLGKRGRNTAAFQIMV